ncbi:hypothetical protein JCM30566_00470 [Marinitoga arctica]
MKFKILLLLLISIFNIQVFSNNMFLTYANNGEFKIDYNFDFEATDLYVANISFFISMSPLTDNYIKVANIDEVLNYLIFNQPGFSINYKFKRKDFNDPIYFLGSFNSFVISLEKIYFNYPISYIVSNGMIGINLKNDISNFFYWINLYNFSETSLGGYYGDKIKVGLFAETIDKKSDYGVFFVFSNNGIIIISKNNIYVEILNRDISLFFDFNSKNNNYMRSLYYNDKKNKFEFNLPIIKNNLYLVINSNKYYGIKFNIIF